MIHIVLFVLLIIFDTITTIIAVKFRSAFEVNPFMRVLLNRSLICFILVKIVPMGLLIYLCLRENYIKFIKWVFWAYLIVYVFGLMFVNVWKGL